MCPESYFFAVLVTLLSKKTLQNKHEKISYYANYLISVIKDKWRDLMASPFAFLT